MTLYYNDQLSGGGADGNFITPTNWWEDSAWTVPHGTLPTASDDVVIDTSVSYSGDYATAGSLASVTLGSGGGIYDVALNGIMYFGTVTTGGDDSYYYTNGIIDRTITGIYGWRGYVNGVCTLNSDAWASYRTCFFGQVYNCGSPWTSWAGVIYDFGYGIYIWLDGMGGSGAYGGSFYGQYYSGGVVIHYDSGLVYDDGWAAYVLYTAGVASMFTGGYGGVYYTLGSPDTSFAGWIVDTYTLDSRCYYNGVWVNGGYNGTHCTDGVADSFTGFDWDAFINFQMGYINGALPTISGYGTPIQAWLTPPSPPSDILGAGLL